MENTREGNNEMDPYKVLGVGRDATDDEIKKAYRDLARKYHPDAYVNNPLADLAQEKMKQVNEAYDLIQKERAGGGSSYSGTNYQSSNQTYQNTGRTYQNPYSHNSYGSGTFARIRQMIAMGNLDGAEAALNASAERSAEWFYLKGNISMRRGWYDDARQNFQTACQMEPGNMEYRSALNQMGNQNYYRGNVGRGGSVSGCDLCSSLLCADCCCECMGGDCISCC